ncbi:MAG: thioredoxin-related protein [Cyclobacteriaceae bacterium]|jgi:thioredoxin-related protein
MSKAYLLAVFFLLSLHLSAQKKNTVRWVSFNQLDDSLAVHPKKVLIDFYTDWCAYCRKMDKVVFTQPAVVERLNTSYYSVRMDAESADTIFFEGQFFINDQLGKTRRPVHQLAQLLALNEGQFTPPVLIILDENFTIQKRYFQYLDSKKLLEALK